MDNTWKMRGICPLLFGETGSVSQRRDDFKIPAEVVFVKGIVFRAGTKACFRSSHNMVWLQTEKKGYLLPTLAETIVPLVRSRKLLAEEGWVWKEFSHRKEEGEIMMRFYEKNITWDRDEALIKTNRMLRKDWLVMQVGSSSHRCYYLKEIVPGDINITSFNSLKGLLRIKLLPSFSD